MRARAEEHVVDSARPPLSRAAARGNPAISRGDLRRLPWERGRAWRLALELRRCRGKVPHERACLAPSRPRGRPSCVPTARHAATDCLRCCPHGVSYVTYYMGLS
jgi:hypothetical protein